MVARKGLMSAPYPGANIDLMRGTTALPNPATPPSNALRRSPARGIAPRISERLHRRSLDRELGEGASPDDSPALALHAQRLQQRAFRARLATALEEAVRAAERPPVLSARAPVNRTAVRRMAMEIELLAAALRAGGCDPRGIALANLLVTDGGGPLYGNSSDEGLRAAVNEAGQGLAGGDEA
jgi:hypothetical protein